MKFHFIKIKQFAAALMLAAILLMGNSPVVAQLICNIAPAPIVQTGSITTGDLTQNGRINRNGITGSCPTGKTNTLFASTVLNRDSYNYTNPTGQDACVQVDVDHNGCGNTTQTVAYSTYDPLNPGNNVIGDFGFSTTGTASFGFPIAAGASFTIVEHEIVAGSGCANYQFTVTYRTNCRQPGYDQTNDGKADPTVFRPSTANWMTYDTVGGNVTQNFGLSSDILTAGNYTGTKATDVSVYRPGSNFWFYGNNTTNPGTNFTAQPWGIAGDQPVPGDYDGDSVTDIAVWRPSNGTWYVLQSSNSTVTYFGWGKNGDIPVVADFDGDLKTDYAVVRPNEPGISPAYVWFVNQSNFGFGFPYFTTWGTAGDVIVPGDYDGNGKADLSVFRPSTGQWYTLQSLAQNAAPNVANGSLWGIAGDIPQPADYDGDLSTDVGVFRPSNGVWYTRNSSTNTARIVPWGISGDRPATAPFAVSP